MSKRARSILRASAATLAAVLLLPVGPVRAASDSSAPHPGAMVFDVMVLRPLGFSVFVVGAVLFLPAALLTAPAGRDSVETALEIFVTAPANDVFQRPLGDF